VLNKVLWSLDNHMDDFEFERLCTDILGRDGYSDIVPVGGPRDGGRDAEIRTYMGLRRSGGVTYFQYSLRKDWEQKLRTDLSNLHARGAELQFYVFVTSRSVTGERRDKLSAETREIYGWELLIYEREWLRHRLEERHPDLAVKYLGVPSPATADPERPRLQAPSPDAFQRDVAWQNYIQGDYEAAVPGFKRHLSSAPSDARAWLALGWCQYVALHYEDAIASIAKALDLEPENSDARRVRAAVLTERGIRDGSKADLMTARGLLQELAKDARDWTDHYNYANVLGSLGEHDGAVVEYSAALDVNPSIARIWKNLGSTYYHLKEHDKEITAYDRALELDDTLAEALASKGVTLLTVRKQPEEAVPLLERAEESDSTFPNRWPHFRYWMARAYVESGRPVDALEQCAKGLHVSPGHRGLLALKAVLLSKLWRSEPEYADEARGFFEFLSALDPTDYGAFTELLLVTQSFGAEEAAWTLAGRRASVDGSLLRESVVVVCKARLEDWLAAYRFSAAYEQYRASGKETGFRSRLAAYAIDTDDDFESALEVARTLSFGLACQAVAEARADEEPLRFVEIKRLVMERLGTSLPRVAAKLATNVRTGSAESFADSLAPVIFAWVLAAGVEATGQLGYIAGLFGVPRTQLNSDVLADLSDLQAWQSRMAGETFGAIADELDYDSLRERLSKKGTAS
jgi:tetratricopeptide (TPR) repeat protein